MAAPLGFNPAQSMLPDVQATIVGLQGGGGYKSDFIKAYATELLEAIKKREEVVEIEITTTKGDEIFRTTLKSENAAAAEKKKSDLFTAIGSTDSDATLRQIDEIDDLTGRNDTGNTPLLAACKTNNLAVIRKLIENGSDVNKTDTE
jgi:hypothetical protein